MTPHSIRSLAGLIEMHMSVRAGLLAWPADCESADRAVVDEIAALVTLGVPTPEACLSVLGDEGAPVTSVLTRAERHGGRASLALVSLAARMEESAGEERAAAAVSAGVRLSAGIVLSLPTAWVVVNALREGASVRTVAVALTGGALAWLGLAWIARLGPATRSRQVEDLAAALAHGLEGGAALDALFDALAATDHAPVLEEAALRVEAGLRWPAALSLSEDPDLARLGRLCSFSLRSGRPLAPALIALGGRLRTARRLGYERALRRAPVRMVIPLTTCVLPGCLLLGASSFLT